MMTIWSSSQIMTLLAASLLALTCSHNKQDSDLAASESPPASESSAPQTTLSGDKIQTRPTPSTSAHDLDTRRAEPVVIVIPSKSKISRPAQIAENDGREGSSVVDSEGDNSRENQWQDGEQGLSADQAGNKKPDLEVARMIRRSLMQNEKLSTYAQNVKIIARNGAVTLKGPVRDTAEKHFIEQVAATTVGEINVKSEIVIVPAKR